MELIAGESLSAVLARTGRLSAGRTLDVLDQTGRALQQAHARSLVHRDIKPGNLLITPGGQVKITDFGIAKVAHQAPVTRMGMVMGTAQYISPGAGRRAGGGARVRHLLARRRRLRVPRRRAAVPERERGGDGAGPRAGRTPRRCRRTCRRRSPRWSCRCWSRTRPPASRTARRWRRRSAGCAAGVGGSPAAAPAGRPGTPRDLGRSPPPALRPARTGRRAGPRPSGARPASRRWRRPADPTAWHRPPATGRGRHAHPDPPDRGGQRRAVVACLAGRRCRRAVLLIAAWSRLVVGHRPRSPMRRSRRRIVSAALPRRHRSE